MSRTLRAGLAWGTPVKPDQLIKTMNAYKKSLPALKAIRLAHRFGTGPQVHISKLPVEILLLIEDFVCIAQRNFCEYDYFDEFDIASDFRCFESKCAPSSHWVEMSPLWDAADGKTDECVSCSEAPQGIYDMKCENRCTEDTKEPCNTCSDEGMGAKECERSCLALRDEEIERIAQDTEYYWECHEERKDAWLARIDKSEKGAFLTYKKMLKQYFGLEVYLANTTVDETNEKRWSKHKNYRWHPKSNRQTTLCYLTLPKRLGSKGKFSAGNGYGDYPTHVDAAQAIRLDMHSLSITDEQRRRFQRALKTLGLEVYLHPSQAHAYTATANLEEESDEESGSDEDSDAAAGEWPQLLLLVKSS
ncbi:hypothetical protein LTS10_004403 [Elasticomyces elasticus]|nr:hypothetical protein LTS10_004403 [Elasticomyces elasticus]